jgi:hypothetical protein
LFIYKCDPLIFQPKISIMPRGSKSGSQGGGRSNNGGKSQRGLASASKQTREEVARKGGEASHGGGRNSGKSSRGGER